jgi:hypothetical protein
MKMLKGANKISARPFRSRRTTFTPIAETTIKVNLLLGLVNDEEDGRRYLDIFTRTEEEASKLVELKQFDRCGKLGEIFRLDTLMHMDGRMPHFWWLNTNRNEWQKRSQIKARIQKLGFDPVIIDKLFPKTRNEKE